MFGWPLLVVAALTGFSLWRDPRKMRLAVALLTCVTLAAALAVLMLSASVVKTWGDLAAGWFVFGGLVLVLIVIVALAVVLVLNAFVMVRREGRRLSNLLGGILGLVLLGFVALGVAAIVSFSDALFVWFFVLGLPAGYLGFGFTAYLLYAGLYLRLTKRFAPPADAVIVLGSGLIDGRVTPLLAARLDAAQRVYERALAAGRHPALVASGGKGSDESQAEGVAMAEYLIDHGVDRQAVLIEGRSRNTDENLTMSKELIGQRGPVRRIAVVTNNFHAFRAALLMRRAKMPGYVIAAPTAGYFWPSAVIREYIAIMRDHLVFNAIMLFITLVPLVLVALNRGL